MVDYEVVKDMGKTVYDFGSGLFDGTFRLALFCGNYSRGDSDIYIYPGICSAAISLIFLPMVDAMLLGQGNVEFPVAHLTLNFVGALQEINIRNKLRTSSELEEIVEEEVEKIDTTPKEPIKNPFDYDIPTIESIPYLR
jgi:hypothetical protein